MTFLTDDELRSVGFRSVGKDVQLSARASIYGASRIELGDHVRIDDFCILSSGEGGIRISSFIHIGAYASLIGRGPIVLEEFVNLSGRVSIYSSNDDYSGEWMTNPVVPRAYTNVDVAPVRLGKHVIVGCGSVVLPGVTIGEGCAVGALSLVDADCDPFGIYVGVPARRARERNRGLLAQESRLRRELQASDRGMEDG